MSKKIMLVEDDTNLREIYGARLMAEGYEIVAAQDGEAALAMAVKEKPDLIISDVMMPKISGFDMLDILRSTPETKNTKVIMMTALSQAEDKARADELGADKYLVKSQVTLEDVARVVHELLGDGPEPVTAAANVAADSTGSTVVADEPTDQPVPEPVAEPVVVDDPLPAVTPDPAAAPVATDEPTDQPVPEPVAEPVVAPAPTDLTTDSGLASSLATADTQNQAMLSAEERAELGDQIASAIDKDMTTAPHEEPVTTDATTPDPAAAPVATDEPTDQPVPEPVAEPVVEEPKAKSGETVIQPLEKSDPHVNDLVASEPDHENQAPNPGIQISPEGDLTIPEPVASQTPGAAAVTEPIVMPANPEPQAPAAPVTVTPTATPTGQQPAEPDKYTIPEEPAEPEITDPNAIAL